MNKFDDLTAAQDNVRYATTDKDNLLVDLLTSMADRIAQLEARLERLPDQTVGDDLLPFEEQVLNVLSVRSGSAREALNFDANVLRAIHDNSYTVYTHIEAEIEEKIDGLLESHAFSEAVAEAVQGSLHGVVEEVLDGLLHDAIVDAVGDAEDIVRKGLRSIL